MRSRTGVLCVALSIAVILTAAVASSDGASASVSQLQEPSAQAFVLPSPPPPPPPPPVAGADEIEWAYAETSYIATGNTNALGQVKDVRPVYPPMLMSMGVGGTVVVQASIDHRGSVTDARVVESVPGLNQSVIDAVKQWQFDPATVNAPGTPIVITVTATFVASR